MKKKYIVFGWLLALLGASCSEQETAEKMAEQGEVRVIAGLPNSRVSFIEVNNTTYSFWDSGDAITLATSTQGNVNYVANLSEGGGYTIYFTPESESLKDIDGETVHACYPSATITNGTVSLPVTSTWNDSQPLPFAYAVSSISNSEVNLQFKHIFSFLKLTVTPDMLSDNTRAVSQVTVSTSSTTPLSVGQGDTFNFSTKTASITHGSNKVQISTNTQVTESGWTVYVPVLPQPAGADVTITLADSEGTTLYTLTKQTPSTGFLAGNVYRVGTTVSYETSYLIDGPTFNASIKDLVNGNTASRGVYDADNLIAKVEFLTEVESLPENYITVSAADSPAPIYASFNSADSLLTVFTPAKDIEVVNASSMFAYLTRLRVVDFGNFEINETTTYMYSMFINCPSLSSLDVSNWDISNIRSMNSMFEYCSSLSSLNLSNWDTSNVMMMGSMFSGCSSLSSLDVSNWNTSNVTYMGHMFNGCSSLSSLNVSNWDTSNVTDMIAMFRKCSSLTTLDVSNWDTSNVANMGWMFLDCSSLSSLDTSNWSFKDDTSINNMFENCASTSQACEITATQEAQTFLLNRTATTSMNPEWFIWKNGVVDGDGSSFEDMPKEEWGTTTTARSYTPSRSVRTEPYEKGQKDEPAGGWSDVKRKDIDTGYASKFDKRVLTLKDR